MWMPCFHSALNTARAHFAFLSRFSHRKMSLTFLKGFDLLLGKGCPISLQLSFQLESHLGLVWIFSIRADGVSVFPSSFLLRTAICGTESRKVKRRYPCFKIPIREITRLETSSAMFPDTLPYKRLGYQSNIALMTRVAWKHFSFQHYHKHWR